MTRFAAFLLLGSASLAAFSKITRLLVTWTYNAHLAEVMSAVSVLKGFRRNKLCRVRRGMIAGVEERPALSSTAGVADGAAAAAEPERAALYVKVTRSIR
jgi:hypothetical protein